MKNHLRLANHNIENATGLEVGMGHYKDTVLLTITGTIARMTVDATDLLAALIAIRRNWAELENKETIKLIERRDVEGRDVEEREIVRCDDEQHVNEQHAGEQRSPEEAKSARRPRRNRVHSMRPVSAPADDPRHQQEQQPIASPATVAKEDVKSTSQAKSVAWTGRDDSIIAILSPEMAASKLRRPLEAILARRRELGLKTSGLVRRARRKSFADASG
jgi:hypothetical protein